MSVTNTAPERFAADYRGNIDQLSADFVEARDNFAAWYDAKSEDEQLLIDEISDRTCYIIDEDEYDKFIEKLADYGITTASQFEDAFYGEWEGTGERIYSLFSEDWIDQCGYSIEPEFISHCIDWELVWYSALRYDFNAVEFKGNTYFFSNHF